MVAMPMNDHLPVVQLRRPVPRRVAGKKFAKQKGLVGQPESALIGGKKVCQLIPEDAGAARLEDHERHPRVDLRPQALQNLLQVRPCLIEKAEIVEGPSAADMLCRELYLESRRAQYLVSCAQHLGMKVVIPG